MLDIKLSFESLRWSKDRSVLEQLMLLLQCRNGLVREVGGKSETLTLEEFYHQTRLLGGHHVLDREAKNYWLFFVAGCSDADPTI